MSNINEVSLFYFTGTGNAKKAAEWIAEAMQSSGVQSSVLNIAQKISIDKAEIEKTDMLGFCYPTHGFNAPPIIIRFLRQFPKTDAKTKVFLLNTRAGMKMSKLFTPGINGLALILPALILRFKGYRVVGYRPLDMPSNWISVHPGLRKEVIKSIVKRCRYITRKFVDKLLAGEKVNRGLYDLPIDILISPIAFAYYFYGRFMLSKTFIATDACNNCGICEKECPVNAISMRDSMPYWAYNCESCMHCMNACPKNAIETPHAYTALIWWLAFSLIPVILLRYISTFFHVADWQNEVLFKALEYGLGILIVFGAYKLLHVCMRYKFFNKLIAYTSLTKYKFWRRYEGPDSK